MLKLPYTKPERKPYNVLASVFNTVMQRELEIVDEYWTDKKLRIFCRSNKNTNEQGSKSQFYYYADEGIKEGTLVNIYGKTYVALNQSTVENELYKKSDLFECNILVDTFSSGYEIITPGFSYYLTSVYGNDYPQISVISGNMEVITEDCETSRRIGVGSKFVDLGAEWRIEDEVVRNGLLHLYISKQAFTPPPERDLEILAREQYEIGTSEYINVWAKRREVNVPSWNTVQNATILWESSDENIVSFDEDGIAYFNNEGTATITATWKEHNITDTVEIEVVAEILPIFTITHAGRPEVTGGFTKSFNANFGFLDDMGIPVNPIWSLDLTSTQQGRVPYTLTNGNRTINITPASNAPLNTTFTLWLTTDSYTPEVKAKLVITIIPLF